MMTTATMDAGESPSGSSSSSLSSFSRSSRSSLTNGTSLRTQNVLLMSLASVLLLTVVQVTRLSKSSAYIEPETSIYMDHDTSSYSRQLKFTLRDYEDEEKDAQKDMANEHNQVSHAGSIEATAHDEYQVEDAYGMLNIHANFPLTCGQEPSWIHPVIEPLVDLALTDVEKNSKASMRYNTGGHSGSNLTELIQLQVCLYDVLNKWRALAERLNMTQWAAHGGTVLGAQCFGAINPWDDDIDITALDCTNLDALWAAGRNVSDVYPHLPRNRYYMNNGAALWDPRLIDDELILLRGGRCCGWYKLMTVAQVNASIPSQENSMIGIDIECVSRGMTMRERRPKRKSSWIKHMQKNLPLDEIMFGPTKIQMMPHHISDYYLKLRYSKAQPCSYPYANGQSEEAFISSNMTDATPSDGSLIYEDLIRKSSMAYATATWYIPRSRRDEWRKQAGNKKQKKLTAAIPNLNEVEIDNSIAPLGACSWGTNNMTLRAIGFNAERGTHWDRFANLIATVESLRDPHVLLLNEMDVGMARSKNVHTVRRLAFELGMNYAFGLEFVELTRGTEQEQNASMGQRDSLGLHGNAILSRCFIDDPMIVRDPLPAGYFANKPVRGINAHGFEIRLGGRMGLFARLYKQDPKITPNQQFFSVGNVHKLAENSRNQAILWDYFGFGQVPSSIYAGRGNDPVDQLGTLIQGDFGPKLCAMAGLVKLNGKRQKTFPCKCSPKPYFGVLSADYFCSSMPAFSAVQVTAPCFYPGQDSAAATLSDHAIVSVIAQGSSGANETAFRSRLEAKIASTI